MMQKRLAVTTLAVGLAAMEAAAQPFLQLAKAGDDYSFVINADPHVSREKPGQQPPQPYNQCLRNFVREVNAMPRQPAFVIFNGDIYERAGAPQTTDILLGILKDLKPLAIAVTGNHDVRDDDVDRIFRPVQKALNGTTDDTFSFDCGRWHFVVMPTRELLLTPQRQDAFLAWLDKDLKTNRERPTMAFMHYHLLPVGTSQLEFYSYSIDYKNRLLDVLTRYGNVRHVFSGHVHSGIQASVKTAWLYKGIRFVIAPSPVRPRPFGEEYDEFGRDGGYYSIVEVRGDRAQIVGRQVGRTAEHLFPDTFRSYDPAIDPRCLTAVWNLPANDKLQNGGFETALDGWHAPHRYKTERDLGYDWQSATDKHGSGERAAHLTVVEKGQGWALGEFTELYQVVRVPAGASPTLGLQYFPEEGTKAGGGYVWLGWFKSEQARCVMLLHWGPKMEAKHTLPRVINYLMTAGEHEEQGLDALARQKKAMFWKIPDKANDWHNVRIDLAAAMDKATGKTGSLQSMAIDRLILGIGTWCADTPGSRSSARFDDVRLDFAGEPGTLTVDAQDFDATHQGLELIVKPEKERRKKGE